ncbi:hypothetical protein, partial [Stenotrophomonas maltophilia]|uniref:hypothetical protein n=1 Tax=Stenotrophomonas maltophilia TaxID=40324 RepID=UPI001C8B2CFA
MTSSRVGESLWNNITSLPDPHGFPPPVPLTGFVRPVIDTPVPYYNCPLPPTLRRSISQGRIVYTEKTTTTAIADPALMPI